MKSLLSEVPAGSDPDGVVTSCRWEVAMLERDYPTARSALDTSAVKEISYLNGGSAPGAVDSVDYSITINDLKYRWEWDPLRDDPRFRELIAQHGP